MDERTDRAWRILRAEAQEIERKLTERLKDLEVTVAGLERKITEIERLAGRA